MVILCICMHNMQNVCVHVCVCDPLHGSFDFYPSFFTPTLLLILLSVSSFFCLFLISYLLLYLSGQIRNQQENIRISKLFFCFPFVDLLPNCSTWILRLTLKELPSLFIYRPMFVCWCFSLFLSANSLFLFLSLSSLSESILRYMYIEHVYSKCRKHLFSVNTHSLFLP